MGADIKSESGHAPLHVRPAPLHGLAYRLPVASAQVKSAVLLAGLYTTEGVRVHQPGPARDHTERMLMAMGAVVTTQDGWVTLSDDRAAVIQAARQALADLTAEPICLLRDYEAMRQERDAARVSLRDCMTISADFVEVCAAVREARAETWAKASVVAAEWDTFVADKLDSAAREG